MKTAVARVSFSNDRQNSVWRAPSLRIYNAEALNRGFAIPITRKV